MITTRDGTKKPLSLLISEQLRNAIIEAEFDFGESLSEDTLAAAFDVSRAPVREAFKILQMQGLVRIVPKSGTYIFDPQPDDVAELCDFRAGLEERAMRLALAQSSERRRHLAESLREQADAMQASMTAGDRRSYGRCDTAYHLAFFHDCGNRYLARAYDDILGRVAALRTHLALAAPGEPARSFDDHEVMIRLVVENKPAELATLLHDHILRTKHNYLNAMAQRAQEPRDARTLRLRRQLSLPAPER